MLKLYEHLGLIVFFYSNEHQPIHVHGRYNEQEIENGEIIEIKISPVGHAEPLSGKALSNFIDLIN